MKRQDSKPTITALEAMDMEPLANETKIPLTCLPCHYTCATCIGPYNYQCLSCPDDAQLFNLTDTELKFYCYPNTLLSQINDASWYYNINVALCVVLFVISFISLYFFITCLLKRYCCGGHYQSNVNGTYNKLAIDEKQHNAAEIEKEVLQALKGFSESESEDDLNL